MTDNYSERHDDIGGSGYIPYPLLGIIKKVYYSDSSDHPAKNFNQYARASSIVCDVKVVRGGFSTDMPATAESELPKVPLALSFGGVQGFGFVVPSAEKTADDLQPFLTDGDLVIVQFIGGHPNMPVITGFYPNPYNLGIAPIESDGEAVILKKNGVVINITKDGDVYISNLQADKKIVFDKQTKLFKEKDSNITDSGNFTTLVKEDYKVEAKNSLITASEINELLGGEELNLDSKLISIGRYFDPNRTTQEIYIGAPTVNIEGEGMYLGSRSSSTDVIYLMSSQLLNADADTIVLGEASDNVLNLPAARKTDGITIVVGEPTGFEIPDILQQFFDNMFGGLPSITLPSITPVASTKTGPDLYMTALESLVIGIATLYPPAEPLIAVFNTAKQIALNQIHGYIDEGSDKTFIE